MKLPFQAPSLGAPHHPAAVVCPSCPQTTRPFPTSAQSLASTPHKLQPNPSRQRFYHVPHLFPELSPNPQYH